MAVEKPYFVITDGLDMSYQFGELSKKINQFFYKIEPVDCSNDPKKLEKTYNNLGYLALTSWGSNQFMTDNTWYKFAESWEKSWSIGIHFQICTESEFDKEFPL